MGCHNVRLTQCATHEVTLRASYIQRRQTCLLVHVVPPTVSRSFISAGSALFRSPLDPRGFRRVSQSGSSCLSLSVVALSCVVVVLVTDAWWAGTKVSVG